MNKITPKFVNREISWLAFNERVLQEVTDESTPLIEKLKFLGIFSNNLDEFFRVRVASLKRMIAFNKKTYDYEGFDPVKILKKINSVVLEHDRKFTTIYKTLLQELEKENIYILSENQLSPEHGAFVTKFFREQVRSNLFPIMISNFKDANTLRDNAIYLAILLEKTKGVKKKDFAIIHVPADVITRFIVLPSIDNKKYIILLEDVIRYCLKEIFSIFDFDSFHAYTFKINRDAELDIDNDISKSFIEVLSHSLKLRKLGRPVRFTYDKSMPEILLNQIKRKLHITTNDNIISSGRYHNFKDFMSFPNVGHKDLEFKPLQAIEHKDLAKTKSILSVIRRKDIMLHYPYQSFQHFVDLLREASMDPKVTSIKMTLYRVAKNSNVINALVNAARNGKEVTVMVELMARFDELANIQWSEKLQEEGVKIIHGVQGLKVHAKLLLIKRKEKGKEVGYANISTGNFNESTAKVYTDFSLLTCKNDIVEDVDKVFALFENNYLFPKFEKLIVAPFTFRDFIINMIRKEIDNKRKGFDAKIIFKLNNLVDENIVKMLYIASQEGVEIHLIIRGICVLVPGVAGLSENIEVVSIVDRYLEHSRVFYYYNCGEENIYISSADLMKRNLDHRIEVICPINDKKLKNEIKNIIDIQLKDNTKARIICKYEKNSYKTDESGKKIRSQIEIHKFLKQLHS